MRSPTGAMLWEIWRVTRVEAAWKLAVGMFGALTVLAWTTATAPVHDPTKAKAFGAALSMVFIVGPQFLGWMFLPRLNGHRPGFPLRLLFVRPMRTVVIVGLALAYCTIVPAIAYLASALLLRAVTGYPYPLLAVAAWIAGLNLVLASATWSARKLSVTTLVTAVFTGAWMMFAGKRLTSGPDGREWHDSPMLWPAIFDFPLTDYAFLAAIGLVAFGVAVARVGRQRRGDTPMPAVFWTPGAGYPEWLVNVFRFPCPTSSATRAQIWFDLKSRGLPVLTGAVTVAIAIPLVFAVSVPIDAVFSSQMTCSSRGCFIARPLVLMCAALSLLITLFQGGNAFGIRYKMGRIYSSPFEMTQPYGTARLAILKLLLRAGCFLAALVVVGGSFWLSLPILGDGVFLQLWGLPLSSLQNAIPAFIGVVPAHVLLALAAVAAIGVVIWGAAITALGALWVRYPRRGNIAAAGLLLFGLTLASLALAARYEFVPAVLVDAVFIASRWLGAAAMLFATAWVLTRGFAERVLTIPYVCGVVAISVAFGAAWLTLLTAIGAQPAASNLWPLPLALTASILAPWALNRIRHT